MTGKALRLDIKHSRLSIAQSNQIAESVRQVIDFPAGEQVVKEMCLRAVAGIADGSMPAEQCTTRPALDIETQAIALGFKFGERVF